MYYFNNELPPQQGWICPKCGRVNAPWMPSCDCVSNQTSGSGTSYKIDTSSVCKTEPFDKDINVRSKDEPYIDIETGILHWCGWKYRRIYEDEPQYEMGMGTLKCDNCSEYGSFKCTKCDGEMYFKRLEPTDEPQTDCADTNLSEKPTDSERSE